MKKKEKTIEVVINKCYGGFGLSNEAIRELHKLGSKYVKVVKPQDYFGKKEWNNNRAFCLQRMVEADKETALSNYPLIEGTKILCEDYSHNYGVGEEDARRDPLLVQVVKKLKDKANGRFAKLSIVRIPVGVKFEIDEYDGIESIHEIHKVWS